MRHDKVSYTDLNPFIQIQSRLIGDPFGLHSVFIKDLHSQNRTQRNIRNRNCRRSFASVGRTIPDCRQSSQRAHGMARNIQHILRAFCGSSHSNYVCTMDQSHNRTIGQQIQPRGLCQCSFIAQIISDEQEIYGLSFRCVRVLIYIC